MRYELLRADAQNKTFVSFTTDSVMKQVAEYHEDHGTPNQQMRAYYLLGCTYRDMGDAPTELEYFQRAVESADTTASDCDYHTLVAVYGQMADIYHEQFLPRLYTSNYSVPYGLMERNCQKLIRNFFFTIRNE